MVAAVVLLHAPTGGYGGQAVSTQGIAGEVAAEVSWGSADGCVQNIQSNDFGELTPNAGSSRLGGFDATPQALSSTVAGGAHVWVGCVTSNAELGSVTASGLHDMISASHLLPLTDVDIGLTNSAGGGLDGGQAGCVVAADSQSAGSCPLAVGGTQQTLVSQASEGTTELNWQYQLDLPADQPVGSYSGGEVIFTATSGAAAPGQSSAPEQAPSNTSAPSISGEAVSGATLTGSTGTWSGAPPITYAYQWIVCDSAGRDCTAIQGAAGSTYIVQGGGVGQTIEVTVTATNGAGSAQATSEPTAVIQAGAHSLACDETWTGQDGDGQWETAGNWSTGAVPDSSDRACIPLGDTANVTSAFNQVGSIGGEGTLVISRGSLELADAAAVSEVDGLTVNGGTLTGAGRLDVSESLSWPAGAMEGSGQTVLEPQASGSVAQSNRDVSLQGRELVDEGVLTVNGQVYGSGVVRNTGTLQKTEGGETAIVSCEIDNEGTVSVTSGQLEFQRGGNTGPHAPGSWSAVGTGTQIVFNAGGEIFALGSTVSISGSMEIQDGTVTAGTIAGANASVTITGRGNAGAGDLEVNGTMPSTLQNVALTDEEDRGGGFLAGSGEVDISGSLNAGGYATMQGTGTTVIEPGARGVVPSSFDVQERIIENEGTLTVTEGGNIQGARATVVNSGTLNVNSENGGLSGEGTLTNTGTLQRTEGSGTAQIGLAIDNEGAVKVTSGQLEFQRGGSSGQHTEGSWSTTGAGTQIVLNSGGNTFALGSTVSISGSMEIQDGTVTAGAIEGSGANVTVTGRGNSGTGILEVDGSVPSTLRDLTLTDEEDRGGGIVTGSSDVDITGSLNAGGYATMEGSGETVLEPGATGSIESSFYLQGHTLENDGTLTLGEGGNIQGGDHSKLLNPGTLIVNSENGGGLSGEGTVINTGALEKSEGVGAAQVRFAIDNEGTVNVTSGQVEFQGGGDSGAHSPGSWSSTGAGTGVVFNSNGSSFALGATVSMSGSIEVQDGTVAAGTIEGESASVTVTGRGNSGTGILEVEGPTPSTVGDLTLTDEEGRGGGYLTGPGDIDVTRSLSAGGYATMDGTGSTVLESGASGVVPSSFDVQERVLENEGTLTVEENGNIHGSGQARIANSGTLNVNSENGLGLFGEGSLTNTGTLQRTEGAGTAQIRLAIDNESVVKVQSGELQFEGGGQSGALATDTWEAAAGASIALTGFNSETYELGATATIVGQISTEAQVSAGAIEGPEGDLTSELGDLKLTGLTTSTLHSLTVAEPNIHTGYDEQVISIADELRVANSLIWFSNTAQFEGPGRIVTQPGSSSLFDPSAWIHIEGGELINEGTATWSEGGFQASPTGIYFVNRGTFNADPDDSNPVVQGCQTGSTCPVFENTGLFTADLTSGPNAPGQVGWRTDIANSGELHVAYETEPECKWEYSETPGPGTEACFRAIREFKGLLLQDGAQVFEGACNHNEPEPCLDHNEEPGEEEELAAKAASGGSLVDASECSLENHCYAKIESPIETAPSGFEGAASQIEPECMTTNSDTEAFDNDEQWVVFNSGRNLDWTEAGATVGVNYYNEYLPSPKYFTADDRVESGYGYSLHNSGVAVPMNQYFQDTIWHLGGDAWEAWTPGIQSVSSPQPSVADFLQVGTEDTSNNVATEERVRQLEYETLNGGWRNGWTPHEYPEVTKPSPGYVDLTSLTTAEMSFNSC